MTPITSGEASGLASAPCSSAPATPSAAPTTSASRVRGSRSCQHDLAAAGPASACAGAARRGRRGAARGPRRAPATRDRGEPPATRAATSDDARTAAAADARSPVVQELRLRTSRIVCADVGARLQQRVVGGDVDAPVPRPSSSATRGCCAGSARARDVGGLPCGTAMMMSGSRSTITSRRRSARSRRWPSGPPVSSRPPAWRDDVAAPAVGQERERRAADAEDRAARAAALDRRAWPP